MRIKLSVFLIVLSAFLFLLIGCSKQGGEPSEVSPSASLVNSQHPVNSEEPAFDINHPVVEKLDQLQSYVLTMTLSANAGPAMGTIQLYEVIYQQEKSSYHINRFMSVDNSEFTYAEELIIIGEDKWVKDVREVWETGDSVTATSYQSIFMTLYIAMKSGELDYIDTMTVSGINANHYQYLYQNSSSKIYGEVWIADQKDIKPVILSCLGAQTAIDESGNAIEDYRYISYQFEVNLVNEAPPVSAP